jgi:hypothetical protein
MTVVQGEEGVLSTSLAISSKIVVIANDLHSYRIT